MESPGKRANLLKNRTTFSNKIMNVTERRERFRAILAGDKCIYPAPVSDPISARIAEDLGYEAGFLAGTVAQTTVLGAPDVAVLTSSELAQQVRRICRATNLSLFVDTDSGYGNALNVMRTVEELEHPGVSAIDVGDGLMPISFGVKNCEEQLVSFDEPVGKIKAALSARQDPSLVIVGHTRATRSPKEGLAGAIRRIKAFESAGVDAIYLSRVTLEWVEAIHSETELPLMLGGIGADLAEKQVLASKGVRTAAVGNITFSATVKSVFDALQALRDGKPSKELRASLASPELLAQVTRQSQYNEWIADFLN